MAGEYQPNAQDLQAGRVQIATAADIAAGTRVGSTGAILVVPADLAGGAPGAPGAPAGATYITQTPNATLTNEQALSTLATGILKNTTTTGILSIAVAGTDYMTPSNVAASYVPYTGATGDVNLGVHGLTLHDIKSDASDGLLIEANNGTDIGILGAGNTANVTWYGSHNFNASTQDTIAAFVGSGKTLSSLATATYPSLTELSYVKGVTSAIQTQINNKQPLDATLTALASYNTNGLLTQTAADTFTGRTITGTTNQVTVTNGDGVSGNPTLSLPQDIHTGANVTFNSVTANGGGVYLSDTTGFGEFYVEVTTNRINIGTGSMASLTVGTERILTYFDAGNTYTWLSGALNTQRFHFFDNPTIAFSASSTVTNAATVYIDGAPTAGANATITNAYALWSAGAVRCDGRILGASANAASANDLNLGNCNLNIITGTTQINAIITSGWTAGSMVTLQFNSALTVKHNTAGGAGTARIFLAGSVDLSTAANTTLTLRYDGVQWQEIARKIP